MSQASIVGLRPVVLGNELLKQKLGAPVFIHVVSRLCGDDDDGVQYSHEELEADDSTVSEGSAQVGVSLSEYPFSHAPAGELCAVAAERRGRLSRSGGVADAP